MNAPELTLLSLAAIALYLSTMSACLFAAWTAKTAMQPPRHLRSWIILAAFFAALMASRGFLVEDLLEFTMRDALRDTSAYAGRRDVQALIVSAILFVSAAVVLRIVYLAFQRLKGRRDYTIFCANMAALAMAALIVFRLISLHAVDRLLYGAAKLNWVVDLGSSLFIAGAALFYVWLIRVDKGRSRVTQSERELRR